MCTYLAFSLCPLLISPRDLAFDPNGNNFLVGTFVKKLQQPLERGKPYIFSYWWAPTDVDNQGPGVCTFKYYVGGGQVSALSNTPAPTVQYQYQLVQFTATLGQANVALDQLKFTVECTEPTDYDGSGFELYFDDFSIAEDCSGTPTSPTPTPSPTPATPDPPVCPALTNLIDNSGIEDASADSTEYKWKSGNMATLVALTQGASDPANGPKPHTGTRYL